MEHICFAWEPFRKHIENNVLHWNQWKTQGKEGFAWEPMETYWKQRFCVGTYGKQKENKVCA